MTVEAVRRMTPEEFRAAVDGFDRSYAADWEAWLAAEPADRAGLFGRILRRWRATRPKAMRRTRSEGRHEGPFLEDLLESAAAPLARLGDLAVETIATRTAAQAEALGELWDVFSGLPAAGTASCVGITKAVLLLTDGRIGPALDKNVRDATGAGRPGTCEAWVALLEGVAEDIAAFESQNGALRAAVSPAFARLARGRLYDMALGPRQRTAKRRGRGSRRGASRRRPDDGRREAEGDAPARPAAPSDVADLLRRRFGPARDTARIPDQRGGAFTATMTEGGVSVSNLGNQPLLPWAVFEEAVALLGRMGGRAARGDAMHCRLGDDGLPLDSVEGHIAAAVYGQREGDSVFRRITPVACILVWAGICGHGPGELLLLG